MRVSFQGEYGAYSEQAIYKTFSGQAEVDPCKSLREAFRKVEEGKADRALVPIENSVGGGIDQTYDLLLDHELFITGETYLKIRHCLLATSEQDLETIQRVYSHPQALKQCDNFLDKYGLEALPVYDTAGAAKRIREEGDPTSAAVAGRIAAERYDLEILADNIQSYNDNITRFLTLARSPTKKTDKFSYKTSISFHVPDSPGALYRSLESFARNDINLTMIHSRPQKENTWNYLFYLDLEGHQDEPGIAEALSSLQELVEGLAVLGSYPKNASTDSLE